MEHGLVDWRLLSVQCCRWQRNCRSGATLTVAVMCYLLYAPVSDASWRATREYINGKSMFASLKHCQCSASPCVRPLF